MAIVQELRILCKEGDHFIPSQTSWERAEVLHGEDKTSSIIILKIKFIESLSLIQRLKKGKCFLPSK